MAIYAICAHCILYTCSIAIRFKLLALEGIQFRAYYATLLYILFEVLVEHKAIKACMAGLLRVNTSNWDSKSHLTALE